MQIELRHNPSFTVARLHLAPGEPVQIESGAMMAHSVGFTITANTQGGVMAGLARSLLAGESFFQSTFTAPPQGGWIDITSLLPGDIIPIDLYPNRPFFVTRGCWLANSYGTQLSTDWGGWSNLFGGEGGFGVQASGQGQVVLSVYGALDVVDLAPGQVVTIDCGHVVAYDLAIQFRLRQAAQGRVWETIKSGEGFVFDFAGPGRVYLQSRNPAAFEGYIRSLVPHSS